MRATMLTPAATPSATPAPTPSATRFQRTLLIVAAAGVLALSACASVPNPAGEMATARAAVENARRAGAGALAASEMSEAQDRLTVAERAHATEDYATARRAAEQARISAEVAEEKTRLAKANQSKAELDDALRALRGEAAARPSR